MSTALNEYRRWEAGLRRCPGGTHRRAEALVAVQGGQQAPAALTCRQLLCPPELQPPSGSGHMLCRQGGSVRMLENKS